MKKNFFLKNKIIWLLMVLCIILLIISICSIKNIKKNTEPVEKGKPLIDTTTDGILNLSGFGIFFDKYEGNLKSSEIGNNLEKVTIKYIPEMFDEIKNFTNEELKAYYSKNSLLLKIRYGKEDFATFSSFINSLKSKNIDLTTWDRLDILKESFKNTSDKDNYAYTEYEVTYQNKEKIKFSLYISKKPNITPTYIISIIN